MFNGTNDRMHSNKFPFAFVVTCSKVFPLGKTKNHWQVSLQAQSSTVLPSSTTIRYFKTNWQFFLDIFIKFTKANLCRHNLGNPPLRPCYSCTFQKVSFSVSRFRCTYINFFNGHSLISYSIFHVGDGWFQKHVNVYICRKKKMQKKKIKVPLTAGRRGLKP